MKAEIISGFPGVGKSYATAQEKGLKISDSDSSSFSWLEPGVRHPDFPQNYIEHIKAIRGDFDVIFVSSHKAVRDALIANQIPFTIVYPHTSDKAEYLNRYRLRGNDQTFIEMMNRNWDKFLGEIHTLLDSTAPPLVEMIEVRGPNQFLNLREIAALKHPEATLAQRTGLAAAAKDPRSEGIAFSSFRGDPIITDGFRKESKEKMTVIIAPIVRRIIGLREEGYAASWEETGEKKMETFTVSIDEDKIGDEHTKFHTEEAVRKQIKEYFTFARFPTVKNFEFFTHWFP